MSSQAWSSVSGALQTGRASGFWSPTLTTKDPEIPYLPLESPSGVNSYTMTISGGFVINGAPDLKHSKTLSISGGFSMGGSVDFKHTKVLSSSGGAVFGGTAPMTFSGGGGATITPERTKTGVGT